MDAQLAAGLVGAAVLALILAVAVGRAIRARRRRASEAALRESERVAMGRLAWLTGRSAEAPEVPPSASRAALAPAAASSGHAAASRTPTWVSPRRRLWRDTAAVLLVAAAGALVVAVVRPPSPQADGGVLGATASPRPVLPPMPTPRVRPSPTATLTDRKSTRLNSSHIEPSRMPSSA